MKKVLSIVVFAALFGFVQAAPSGRSQGREGVVVHHYVNTGDLVIMDNESGEFLNGKGRPNIYLNVGDDVVFIYISKGHPPFIILKDIK